MHACTSDSIKVMGSVANVLHRVLRQAHVSTSKLEGQVKAFRKLLSEPFISSTKGSCEHTHTRMHTCEHEQIGRVGESVKEGVERTLHQKVCLKSIILIQLFHM